MLRYCLYRQIRPCSSQAKSSFDVDVVSLNYVQRTEWAAANFGNSPKNSQFRMVLPPPNVTGKLHLGHALAVTIEDSLCRHHRIQGGVATWLPGFDHAGIATQSVVERELWRERKVRPHDIGKDEFLDYCQKWSSQNSAVIGEQLKRLGATLDWNNSYYTLDKRFSSAVTRAFCQLHSDGLIYRDKRLVNWCPHLRSSLSDQEVERIDVSPGALLTIPFPTGGTRAVSVGTMHRLKYQLEDGSGFLEVATTRPETIFADVALAVNPSDDRFASFIGKRVIHPLLKNRYLPILADESVKTDKGTGIVKITPAHDYFDYEIASRHWESILHCDNEARTRNCLDDAGRLTNSLEELDGVDRFDARRLVVEKLTSSGHYVGVMKHDGAQVNICSRTGDIIEPRMTEQWFMNTTDMHKEAENAIRSGRIRVLPSYQEQKLFDWLSNKEPWCLSRQLVWGHQVPAYRHGSSNWVVTDSYEKAQKLLDSENVVQDKDVLDTWFSSSLVPLVTAGWMEGKLDASKVPINVMETGWDIMGFWVARMIMLTTKLSGGQVPFSEVLLHGLIRDPSGRKMSKSLGNVIDPIDVLDGISQGDMIKRLQSSSLKENEIISASADICSRYPAGIPKSGADALRFALLRHDVLATDVPLNVADLAGEGLRFCNKLWNLIVYMESVTDKCHTMKEVDSEEPADLWIISRLAATLKKVDDHMNSRAPHLAFAALHKFILGNLCDVYLETTKRAVWRVDPLRLEQIRSTLTRVVQPTLVQLSVFMPFVSEHLYERVFSREAGAIYFDFVKPSMFSFHRDEDLEDQMKVALSMVSAVRSVRQQLQLPSKMTFDGILMSRSRDVLSLAPLLSDLVDLQLNDVIDPSDQVPAGFMPCALTGLEDRLALRIEVTHRAEFVIRLERQLEKVVERQRQFTSKAEKYESIVSRDSADPKVKASVIEKNRRKAAQSRGVAKGALEESERLRQLLTEVRGESSRTISDTS